MKKLLLLALLFLSIPQAFWYTPTQKDEILLEKVYQKIDTLWKKDSEKVKKLWTQLYTLKEKIKKKEKQYYLVSKIYEHIFLNYSTSSYSLIKVLDGDTISIEYDGEETKVRLIGINAPETKDVAFNSDCLWTDAKNFLETKLKDYTEIQLELDSTQWKRDSFWRLLWYIFVWWENINKSIIEAWYATEYTYNKPYKYQTEFKNAENDAKDLGLWIHSEICTLSQETTNTWAIDQNLLNTPTQNYSFYTSSHHTSRLYYCETDSAWEWLSKTYLRNYPSEAELLKVYPSKTLNKHCN